MSHDSGSTKWGVLWKSINISSKSGSSGWCGSSIQGGEVVTGSWGGRGGNWGYSGNRCRCGWGGYSGNRSRCGWGSYGSRCGWGSYGNGGTSSKGIKVTGKTRSSWCGGSCWKSIKVSSKSGSGYGGGILWKGIEVSSKSSSSCGGGCTS